MHTLKHTASAAALVASALLALGSGSSKEKDSPTADNSATSSATVKVTSATPDKPADKKGTPLGYCEAKGGYECEDYTIFTDGTADGQKKDCHGNSFRLLDLSPTIFRDRRGIVVVIPCRSRRKPPEPD